MRSECESEDASPGMLLTDSMLDNNRFGESEREDIKNVCYYGPIGRP